MSLGLEKTKTYLNIKQGRIYEKETAYDYVKGYLKDIEVKEREFRGEVVKYWYVNIESSSGELYSLAIPYYSGIAKSLFNSLASAEDFHKEIKIQPYLSGEYTKVLVYSGQEKLSWKEPQLPPVDEVVVGDKTVKDETKRMEFIVNLVNQINTKI